MQVATLKSCVFRAKSSGKPVGRADDASDALAEYIARFWSYVDKENGPLHPTLGRCWPWTGACAKKGYGHFGNVAQLVPGGPTLRAHRVSYFLDRGALPAEGFQVRHLCNYRPCVRPDHLEEGTALQNAADAVAADRLRRGSRHYRSRLTEEDVPRIRERRASGERVVDLAAEYDVSPATIRHACTGEQWARAAGPIVAPRATTCGHCGSRGHTARTCATRLAPADRSAVSQ